MRKQISTERNYLVHPAFIAMTLFLVAVTALFLGFCGAYIYNRMQMGLRPVEIPILFYTNSLILIASSYTLVQAKKAYINDQTDYYKKMLAFTVVLSIAFMIAQYFGWMQLFQNNVKVDSTVLGSYLYLISGVHFLHVAGGIPFLAYFLYIAHTKMKEPISVLLYFSDKQKERGLKLLNIYWHYLDILWLVLVLFFLLNLFI
jgi:cytochrome c oxidase subunit III